LPYTILQDFMTPDPKECLYISDLDGTLLEPGSRFPQASVDRLNRMIDRGLKFTIATARNYDSVHPILRGVRFNLPVILFNGVYLTHFDTGENLHLSSFIPREIIDSTLQDSAQADIDPFVYTFGGGHQVLYRRTSNAGARNYLNSLEGDNRLRYVEQYEFSADQLVAGLLLIDTHKALEPVYRTLHDQHAEHLNLYFADDISMPGYSWLQMFHREANKGSMVKKLARHLRTPLSHVVVFGDYLNDLEMFEVAGQSLAVANALPEVLQAADQVIGSNAEGAVLDHLESLGF